MRDIEFDRELIRVMSALRARAHAMTRDRFEAEDLLQSTLERALLYSENFKRGSDLRRWLFTIMRHHHADRRRRIARAPATWCDPQCIEDRQDTLRRDACDLLEMADVRAALAVVPEPLKTTFELACMQRLSYAEVARQLNAPVATIATRVMRARSLLRAVLRQRVLAVCGATEL